MENWFDFALGACSTLLAYIGLRATFAVQRRGQKKDDTTEGEAAGSIKSDIKYIKDGIDELKKRQEKTDERYIELVTRVTMTEASAERAHKRLDQIGASGWGTNTGGGAGE